MTTWNCPTCHAAGYEHVYGDRLHSIAEALRAESAGIRRHSIRKSTRVRDLATLFDELADEMGAS